MRIIDLHGDALAKIEASGGGLSYTDAPELMTNRNRLKEGGVAVQGFAIFVDPALPGHMRFQSCLDQIHYFYEEILDKHDDMTLITDWSQIAQPEEGKIGALLTLEGADPIENDLKRLHLLYRLGVRSVGLTWNYANQAADGVLEPRGGGLTSLGREIVALNNRYGMLTDVSHLSERAFWDVLECADYPIASHSNARALCGHPRNLTDRQLRAMFERGAQVHVVYFPPFVVDAQEGRSAGIGDLAAHIDRMCELGGERHIGFGSDFDGITETLEGLEHAGRSQNLIDALLKRWSEEQVRGFAYGNFARYVSGIGRAAK
ncbi:dipeptidase [Saccharibacillus alkalitolerans]|uniref:Membrane dipeptidase n=1 Tax=Saccharibacillus alkalitolerans TaxID=2705290 RepID=A0ABX0F2Z0_9BACL|nr:dipeptidase [Saccharibacillus alkalitolerans]NGZ74957.1 membrane dipeptidase [Saccharibacillus alkalitolerans]